MALSPQRIVNVSVTLSPNLKVNLAVYGDECEGNAEMLKDNFICAEEFFNKNSMIQVDFGSILEANINVNKE